VYPLWIAREIAKNLVVRLAPTLTMRLRKSTGRGEMSREPRVVAEYVWQVFQEYAVFMGVRPEQLWEGRTVVELGPGDNLGVGLLSLAHGAEAFVALDRYWIVRQDAWARALYAHVLTRLQAPARERLARLDVVDGEGLPKPGGRLQYAADFAGAERLLGQRSTDLIISRAVLEHVRDLEAVIAQCSHGLRPGGLMIHKADLRDHGLTLGHPLDFLRPPSAVYRWMTSARAVHNRARLSDYVNLLSRVGFQITRLVEEHGIAPEVAEPARPRLAAPFRERPPTDLTCTVIFFSAVKR